MDELIRLQQNGFRDTSLRSNWPGFLLPSLAVVHGTYYIYIICYVTIRESAFKSKVGHGILYLMLRFNVEFSRRENSTLNL